MRKNITRNPDIPTVIAIRDFLINMIVKPHPNKNNNIDILLPANNIAAAWIIITDINKGLLAMIKDYKRMIPNDTWEEYIMVMIKNNK